MKRSSFLLLLLPVTLNTVPAQADITRGCNAEYRIQVFKADGRSVTRPEVKLGRFTSRGKCRGKAWANDCRRAARSYANSCMQSHWIHRWSRETPGQCRRFGSVGPQDYSLKDLKAEIEWYTCFGGAAPGFRDEVILKLRGVTSGDKRCGGDVALSSNYRVTGEMCDAVDSRIELPPSKR
jgi:hypothetical protein